MTYIIDVGGYLPNRDHCLFTRTRLSGVTKDDLLAFAKDNGIRHAESIINVVVSAATRFRQVAEGNGVRPEWIGRVETCLRQHMTAWGYEQTTSNTTQCKGADYIRLEQAYKGNIHLLATTNGKERKYVIRKGTEMHTTLTQQGLSNVSADTLVVLAKTYGLLP